MIRSSARASPEHSLLGLVLKMWGHLAVSSAFPDICEAYRDWRCWGPQLDVWDWRDHKWTLNFATC